MKVGALGAVAVVFVCGAAHADDARGGAGESCRARSDCAEGLSCLQQVCSDPAHPNPTPQLAPTARPRISGQAVAGRVLLITGISLGAAAWIAGGIAAAAVVAGSRKQAWSAAGEAWVPVAGPFIMLADSDDYTSTQIAATATGAVLQSIGFAALVTGVILMATAPSTRRSSELGVWITPWTAKEGGGLALAGTF